MNQTAQKHHEHDRHTHQPYWRRMHRDWRFYVAVIVMLAAMITYVMTDDLAWGQPHPETPPTAGK